MSAIAQQESFVKESLFQFIIKNVPKADLNVIDDIVLSYVISILEEASQDPCFDVEGFIEMMAAYVPEFAHIDAGLVCSWVLELEAEISRHEETDSSNGNDDSSSDKVSLTLQSLSEMLPPPPKNDRSHTNSESSGSEKEVEGAGVNIPTLEVHQCQVLAEMFPNACAMEIKHCLSIAFGDVERAAATLLHRRELGLTQSALHAPVHRTKPVDEQEVKQRIIDRYSYVDENSGTKEHRPLAPKIEPKKMVRYRDNKIVSLKGERYTEVPKSGADEEHLKKPKKQHAP
ncbi:CUE domain-containing protein 2 [Bombyx mandarina]|uniref:CUE domain-containing protein 2 n=2 Tax=Bombyx TaxID=7090 RepID=A0A8R2M746_BOMMO|nr:CUE domain-containing protein 2 [Bombyx mandarina]XP_037875074.1 CUE domain-containing protein 2 [Bombyx mori]